MKLLVGPLEAVGDLIRLHEPDRVISLLAPGQAGPRIEDRAHLRLDCSDVAEATPGLTLADGMLIERLIAFGLAPPQPRCVLIHCWFAVSRSPAAALVLTCAAEPSESERALVERLRTASPSCSPNKRIVALADTYLRRDGRLIHAVEEAGQASAYSAPRAFSLDVLREDPACSRF